MGALRGRRRFVRARQHLAHLVGVAEEERSTPTLRGGARAATLGRHPARGLRVQRRIEHLRRVEVAREAGDEGDCTLGAGLPDEPARVRLGDDLQKCEAGSDVRTTTDRERPNGQPIVGRRRQPRRVDAVDGDQLGRLARERIGLVDVRCALGHRQQLAHLVDEALARLARVRIHGVHHGRGSWRGGVSPIGARPAGVSFGPLTRV